MSQQLQQHVEQFQNVIFVKPGCPYCSRALAHAEELKNEERISGYKVFTLGEDFNDAELAELTKAHGGQLLEPTRTTKPQVFMSGKYVGDSESFSNYRGE